MKTAGYEGHWEPMMGGGTKWVPDAPPPQLPPIKYEVREQPGTMYNAHTHQPISSAPSDVDFLKAQRLAQEQILRALTNREYDELTRGSWNRSAEEAIREMAEADSRRRALARGEAPRYYDRSLGGRWGVGPIGLPPAPPINQVRAPSVPPPSMSIKLPAGFYDFK